MNHSQLDRAEYRRALSVLLVTGGATALIALTFAGSLLVDRIFITALSLQMAMIWSLMQREDQRQRGRIGAIFGRRAAGLILDYPEQVLAAKAHDVAVLAIQLKNLSALTAALTEEQFSSSIAIVSQLVISAVEAGGGVVVESTGTDWLAVFPGNGGQGVYPAFQAAATVQMAFTRSHGPWIGGVKPHVGCGLVCATAQLGLVRAGERLVPTCRGRSVELAREVATAASDDEVLLTQELVGLPVEPREPVRSVATDSMVQLYTVPIRAPKEPAPDLART